LRGSHAKCDGSYSRLDQSDRRRIASRPRFAYQACDVLFVSRLLRVGLIRVRDNAQHNLAFVIGGPGEDGTALCRAQCRPLRADHGPVQREWAELMRRFASDHRSLLERRKIGRPKDFGNELSQLRYDDAHHQIEVGKILAQLADRRRGRVLVVGCSGDEALVLQGIQKAVDGRSVNARPGRKLAGSCATDPSEFAQDLESPREGANVTVGHLFRLRRHPADKRSIDQIGGNNKKAWYVTRIGGPSAAWSISPPQ
jgi:hypothetical protein